MGLYQSATGRDALKEWKVADALGWGDMSVSGFEIAGLVLELLSLLKDLKDEQSLGENLDIIKRAIAHQNNVIQLLEENKYIHDQFEQLRIKIGSSFEDFDQITNTAIGKKLRDFFSYEQRTIKNRKLTVNLLVSENTETPLPIRSDINTLRNFFPELVASLQSYSSILSVLRDLNDHENYGLDFKKCISNLSDCLDRVTSSADTVILSTVPVLAFMHHQIGEALDQL